MDPVKIALLLFSAFLIPTEILTSDSKSQRHHHRSLTNMKQGRLENTRGGGVNPLPLKQLREDLMEKYENRINRVRRDSSEEHLQPEEGESDVTGTGGGQGSSVGSSMAYGAGSSYGSQSIIRLDFGLLRLRNDTNSGASSVCCKSVPYISVMLSVLVILGVAC
ncbi:uncharacterized protein LOC119740247 [Patiria miniata]|uniref:Uncharacterized protein n=1 Tax=Patiria miniata TaxID=46514 RepID=A0A914B647_PATMI|nr:uncharacterized protein LOC119740247 [Patiria miniata]